MDALFERINAIATGASPAKLSAMLRQARDAFDGLDEANSTLRIF